MRSVTEEKNDGGMEKRETEEGGEIFNGLKTEKQLLQMENTHTHRSLDEDNQRVRLFEHRCS